MGTNFSSNELETYQIVDFIYQLIYKNQTWIISKVFVYQVTQVQEINTNKRKDGG